MGRNKVLLFSAVTDDLVFMPLSILSLATVLHRKGFETQIIDIQVDGDWREKITTHIKDTLIFGVSCYTSPSINAILDSIQIARREAPDVPIIWGGYHASLAYREILEEGLVDYTVRGLGEYAIVGLAEILRQRKHSNIDELELQTVPNLAYRSEQGIVETPTEMLKDMNDLPSLNYNLINTTKYLQGNDLNIPYISSYGCPWACTFCAEPTFSGRRFRPLTPKRVVDDLANIWDQHKATQITVMDPNYSSNPKRVIEITKELNRRGTRIEMSADMRAPDIIRISQLIDLNLLYKSGLRHVFIGAESGSDRMLKSVRKGQTCEQILEACRQLDAAGIKSETSFIHDLPGETEEDINLTFRLLKELCKLSHNVQSHHFFVPFPYTEIFSSLTEKNAPDLPSNRTQREWGNTSTFYGNEFWQGNVNNRKEILRRL